MADNVIFDAHCDTVSELINQSKRLSENDMHIDMRRLSKYSNYTQVFAAFIDPKYRTGAMRRAEDIINMFYRETAANNITVCKSYTDWKNAKTPVRAFLSLEGGDPIHTLSDLRHLYDLGVRMIAPTWNFSSDIACGVCEKEDTGLSVFGCKAIKEMEHLGIIIDASHLSPKSFWDIAEITSGPICASHSNSIEVTGHIRNLTDRQFMQIVKSGGVAGINFYPPFLGENIRCAIDHINRFIALGGENNIGLGSDFDGVDRLPDGICGVQDMGKFIKSLPYSTEIREKIAYRNFMRVIEQVLP